MIERITTGQNPPLNKGGNRNTILQFIRDYWEKTSPRYFVIFGGLTAAIVSLIVILTILGSEPTSPFPKRITSSVNYALLYPTELPSGYSLDMSSFSSNSQAVLYEAVSRNAQSNPTIYFSVQPVPAGFSFKQFYSQHLGHSSSITTPLGKAEVGLFENASQGYAFTAFGSLAYKHSWLIITTANQNGMPQLGEILASTKVAKN